MSGLPSPTLSVVALFLWALGALLYTRDVWTRRGLTDHGTAASACLMSGSLALTVGLILAKGNYVLIFLAAVPAGFFASLLWLKGRDRLRARYHWFTPASGPLVPPAAPDVGHPGPDPPMSIHDWLASQEERESEAERAGRVTKMFG